jgi:ATP-dependent helicase/nuclease subunit A
LFRLTEEQLQSVLARRGLLRSGPQGDPLPPRSLWQAIYKDPEDPVTGPAVTLLTDWRKHLGFAGCHDLLRRIFRDGLVLEKYHLARGDQARYNLLRLFDLATGPELAGTPTVRRLVDLIERAQREGGQEEGTLPSRSGLGRVRFMTIHGAKGLEAPVVLLVDADRSADRPESLVRTAPDRSSSPLLFGVTRSFRQGYLLPEGVSLPAAPLHQVAERAHQANLREETNLLYVALTRARDRLYVLGGEKPQAADHPSPLRQLRETAELAGCGAVELADPAPLVRPPRPLSDPTEGTTLAAPEDSRLWRPPVLREHIRVSTPSAVTSRLESTAAAIPEIPGPAGQRAAAVRGSRVHLLLQLAGEIGRLPPGTGPVWQEAATVHDDPGLNWIFRPQDEGGRGLSEVPLIHRLTPGSDASPEEQVIGVIDRLILRPGRADIVDFKTNRTGGDSARRAELAAHYRPQLLAYREAVRSIFPEREVRTWLLFTEPVPDGRREAAAGLVEVV